MADCGIAAWDMIETMQGPCLPTQRPAHDQPHHHFDALAAGFTQIFDMRNVAQGIAFADKAIEEHIVPFARSEEHTSELQSLMRISYAVFCLKKKKTNQNERQHI